MNKKNIILFTGELVVAFVAGRIVANRAYNKAKNENQQLIDEYEQLMHEKQCLENQIKLRNQNY